MDTHDRIRAARDARKMSQAALADKLGVTQQTVQYYESGRSDPKASMLVSIANALGVSVTYLLGLDGAPWMVEARPATRRIPVLGRIAAGTPREAIAQSDDSWWLLDPTRQNVDDLFYLRVSGDSMDRVFPDGALLLVDPKSEVRSGDVGVVFVNGDDATVKRVYFAGNTVVLHPESTNDEHRDRSIDRSDSDAPEVRIVGKVVGYTSPEGWRA